ncbi:MAG: amidase [Actinomycetota bacterium]|nr:amidase [Actinomycetota bacterium]
MIDTDLATRTATELIRALCRREVSSRELLQTYRTRIDELNPVINAVVTWDDRAAETAAAADDATARGELWGPLHGLPITIKDALETAGLRTTAGAPEWARHVPARDADAVARLRSAGAIVIGKTNLPAYAADSQTFNPLFGTTNNPWNTDRAVGGSSGGSAAAVAAGLTGLDLGSDLGGSIRNPAGYCGVFGLRPSHGIIPTRGHLPGPPGTLAELDLATVGPLARGAADLGLALDVLAGPDAAQSVAWRLDLPGPRADTLAGYRVAAWLDDDYCSVDADVLRVLGAAVDAVAATGAKIDTTARPCPLRAAERLAQQLIQAVFAGAYPAPEYERLQNLAATASPADDSAPVRHARNVTARVRDLAAAREAKAQLSARCAEFFAEHDVLLCPITPTTAIPHDHQSDVDARRIIVNGQPRPYGDQIPWASLAGLCGLPAVVLPAGLARGLPVGLQIIGPRLEDRTVIDVAARIAKLTGGYLTPPSC